jgi:hypothetical protein
VTEGFRGFPQSVQADAGWRPLPSVFFSIHYSSVILSPDAVATDSVVKQSPNEERCLQEFVRSSLKALEIVCDVNWCNIVLQNCASRYVRYGTHSLNWNLIVVRVHVYGMRLRLWTAATNWSFVHPPGGIWVWRATALIGENWFSHQSSLLVLSASHLVAKQEEYGEEILNFAYEVSLSFS